MKTTTTQDGHALLSPSSAHRWMMCTPSAVLESKYPDKASSYSLEGTIAHALCAMTLCNKLADLPGQKREMWFAQSEKFGRELKAERLKASQQKLSINYEAMEQHAEEYAAYVLNLASMIEDARVHVETKLDLRDWARGSFGTSDCTIVGRHDIVVVDFKYGMGVRVDAPGNPQMRMYALGALDEFVLDREIKTVTAVIFQPRLQHVSSETLSVEELEEWGAEQLRPLAEVAYRGLGAKQSGRWCNFCKHACNCKELDRIAGVAYSINMDRQDARSIGEVCLPMIGPLELWISEVRARGLAMLLDGKDVPGYKVVPKRTLRKITDTGKVKDLLLANGFESHEVLKEAPLKSLGELEKLVGKKKFGELCGEYVVKPEGEPTIVAEDDSREPVIGNQYFKNIEIDA